MSCPTCDHTMNGIGNGVFWCPRCGTLKDDVMPYVEAPKLVLRCRYFETSLNGVFRRTWQLNGIAESINLPCNRPEPSP